MRDPWLKETQRSLGGFTAQRRWVHMYLNGLYWGVYDLEEHHDAETISRHLAAANPAVPPSELAPEKILFLNYNSAEENTASYAADPIAQASWDAVVTACAAASTAAGPTASPRETVQNAPLYNMAAQLLDIPDYIDYILTLSLTGKDGHNASQFRGWRHPLTGKWHLIAWDGDAMFFLAGPEFLNEKDHVNHFTPLPAGQDPEYIVPDLRPHEYLKFHPAYQAAFDARLRVLLKTGTTAPGGQPLLGQASLLARFDALALDFRQTLECEAMRWGGTSAVELPMRWGLEVDDHRRVLLEDGQPAASLLRTRQFLKTNARESRLLNDIPPPVITVSGDTVTIARSADVNGRIYFAQGDSASDPRFELLDLPVYSPPHVASVIRLRSAGKYISARIFGPDLDGELSWSALSTFIYPD